jgi:hypothetical protein
MFFIFLCCLFFFPFRGEQHFDKSREGKNSKWH